MCSLLQLQDHNVQYLMVTESLCIPRTYIHKSICLMSAISKVLNPLYCGFIAPFVVTCDDGDMVSWCTCRFSTLPLVTHLDSVFVHVQYAFNICILECYYFRNKVLFADVCGSQDNYIRTVCELAFSACMYVCVPNAHLCVEWMWSYTEVYKWGGSIHQREYLSHLCVPHECVSALSKKHPILSQ